MVKATITVPVMVTVSIRLARAVTDILVASDNRNRRDGKNIGTDCESKTRNGSFSFLNKVIISS